MHLFYIELQWNLDRITFQLQNERWFSSFPFLTSELFFSSSQNSIIFGITLLFYSTSNLAYFQPFSQLLPFKWNLLKANGYFDQLFK